MVVGRFRHLIRKTPLHLGTARQVFLIAAIVMACSGAKALPPSDTFNEDSLDSCRWWFVPSNDGTYKMENGLVLTSDGRQSYSESLVYSQYYAPADFDVQVDYSLDASSWNATIVPAGSGSHLQGAAFTIYFDGLNSLSLFRYRDASSEQLVLYGTLQGKTVYSSVPWSALSGKLRIARTGSEIQFMGSSGTSWTIVGTWTGPVSQAILALGSANVNAMNSVTTTFHMFQVNSGLTNFRSYQLPSRVLARSDFTPGFASASDIAFLEPKGYHPYPILAANGMSLAHVRITTISSAILEDTPPSKWASIPWNPDFWSSLQVGAHLLGEAQQLGMQNYLEMFLSDQNADASVQNAPAAWRGLSVDDTAAKLKSYTYETASYFKKKGVKIVLYGIGAEIGLGILNFRPGERLPAPQNASPYEAIEFMQKNIWPTEAILLKAAIEGVKLADPGAKIALHIEGLGLTPADVFVRGFFQSMIDLGVPFDVGALSLPYMSAPGWPLPQYTYGCWARRMDAAFRDISLLGKKGMIAEGAYQNSTVHISLNDPMPGFPLTPQGQEDWVNATLRFASNNPNVLSFNYFYPEFYYGMEPKPPPDIEAFGLFENSTTPQPGLAKFRPFLGAIKAPHVQKVANSEGSETEPIIPGQLATVSGENLAGFTVAAEKSIPLLGASVEVHDQSLSEQASSVAYPQVLADVVVTVNGEQAQLLSVSDHQIRFLVPINTLAGHASLVVSAGLEDSAPFSVVVAASGKVN